MKTRTAVASAFMLATMAVVPAGTLAAAAPGTGRDHGSSSSSGPRAEHLSGTTGHQTTSAKDASGHAKSGQDTSGTSKAGTNKAGKNKSGKGGSGKGKGAKPKQFHVAPGYTFTNPLNRTKTAILHKLLRIINATPPGAKIRMASWNFDSSAYVRALTAAHNRGVSVRIIMARTLAEAQGPGQPYGVLKHNLMGANNARRSPDMQSWFHTCDHSCRGKGGSMHAKYYIFSQSGASKHVVVNTSANLTGASANVQWNEMYTVVNQDPTFDTYMHVFNQATRDRPAAPVVYKDGDITGWFYPRPGRSDLVMDMLNRVVCGNAKGAGIDGHTAIRVAQDVFNNKRGVRIAKKLLSLYRHGCNVKLVYSQAVGDTRPIIKQLPNNHLVQDRNGDGAYDRYLHAKLLTISGNYDGDRGHHVVMDGSANYSATALLSDEQGMIITKDSVEKAYGAFINQMFNIHLVSATYSDTSYDGRLIPGAKPLRLDPYRLMEG